MSILCEPAVSAGELITSIGGQVRGADSLGTAARLLDNDPTEMLVVIGPDLEINDALAFAAHLRLARPAVGVILAREYVDVALLSRALQSGVREVVIAGDHAALAAACRRSREVSRRLLAASVPEDALAARGGTDCHRLRRQGRLRQDDARPSIWPWRWPGEPASKCAWWTWTSRSATWP